MLEEIVTKQRLRGIEALSDEELLALLFEDEAVADFIKLLDKRFL